MIILANANQDMLVLQMILFAVMYKIVMFVLMLLDNVVLVILLTN